MPHRRAFLQLSAAALAAILAPASAFVPHESRVAGAKAPALATSTSLLSSNEALYDSSSTRLDDSADVPTVAYKSLSLQVPGSQGTSVPVACWFPVDKGDAGGAKHASVSYKHKISVKRIGQLLAGWDWIPGIAEKSYTLSPSIQPTSANVISGDNLPFRKNGNVVIIAHGYLGSRFDFSATAEALAAQGFVCIAPEYPESLAASYDRLPDLDRSAINNSLLKFVKSEMDPKAYGIIGHSLGCGTALQTGDDTWARVLIAGKPPSIAASEVEASTFAPFTSMAAWKSFALSPNAPLLFISSVNDCTVKFGGGLSVPPNYKILDESQLSSVSKLDMHTALVFDRPDAPNHISYLSEGTNNAMIGFLSPLLPVAQAFNIPVLDFDKYKVSQDSIPTGKIINPLIAQFLRQQMGA